MAKPKPHRPRTTADPAAQGDDMGEVILHQAQRIVDLVERRAERAGLRIGAGSVSILLHALALKAAHAAGKMPQAQLDAGAADLGQQLQGAMKSYHAQFVQHQQLLDAPTPPVEKAN